MGLRARLAACASALALACAAGPGPGSGTESWWLVEVSRAPDRIETPAALCEARGYEAPGRPFESDGCSAWPDGWWVSCCVAHDADYWCGGTPEERRESDARLRACVGGNLGSVMYLGVRAGGAHWLPTPFRWGYGRRWPATR